MQKGKQEKAMHGKSLTSLFGEVVGLSVSTIVGMSVSLGSLDLMTRFGLEHLVHIYWESKCKKTK